MSHPILRHALPIAPCPRGRRSFRPAALKQWLLLGLALGGLLVPTVAPAVTAPATSLAQAKSPQTESSVGSKSEQAHQLMEQGLQQLDAKQLETALQTFQQAVSLYQADNNRAGEGYGKVMMGLVYRRLGNLEQATQFSQQALTIAQAIQETKLAELANRNLTAIQAQTQPTAPSNGNPTTGQPSQPADPRLAEAVRLNAEGTQLKRQNRHQEALEKYRQALVLVRQIGERRGESLILLNIGDVYNTTGQVLEALKAFQQALPIAKELGDRPLEASILNNLGVVYDKSGDPQRAIQAMQAVLQIRREVKDRDGEGTALNNLASIYRQVGQFQKALELQQQALVIARELGDRSSEMISISNTGAIYRALGQLDKALDYYQQALVIAQKLGDRSAEASLLNNLGRTHGDLRNFKKALELFEQSLPLLREVGDRRRESSTISNIALTYSALGQRDKALEYLQQSLTIAKELGDIPGQATFLNNIGATYGEMGNSQRAIEYYKQSLPLLRQIGKRVEEGITVGNIGTVYSDLGQYDKAEPFLLEAIVVWESLRPGLTDANKVSLFETQVRTYRILQEALVNQKKYKQALEVSERGRARAFVELLADKLKKRTGQTTDTQVPSVQPLTIADIQQIAKDQKATLVEYSIQNEALYIWVVKPTGEIFFESADLTSLKQDLGQAPLQTLVESSRSEDLGVRGRSLSFVEDTAAINQAVRQVEPSLNTTYPKMVKLHALLIEPIVKYLPTNPNDRVIFIPQGELFFVPFPALQDAEGKFLVEKHTIVTAPAIQVLQLTRQQRLRRDNTQSSTALIVGNPTMPKIGTPPKQLSSLPGAETEAKTIAQLFKVKPVLGGQATKSNVLKQMASARLIHLATHGLLDDYRGLGVPGAIALAPDAQGESGNINGLLTANEILDLKLSADLIVLSACDTGRGRVTGDGVIGLSRSLVSAGAPSVVVSLWKVPDDSTAFLMQQFYENLLNQKLDKAAALRQAMLATHQRYPDPKDWAAFTLIGEAE